MGICLRSRQQDSVQPSVLQFIQFSNVCSALCLSVSQPLAPAHSVGLTQHCCGWTPRITRCSRLELCSGERSDITAWSVVSRMTHGTRQKKTAGNITRSETTALTTENHLGLFTLWRLKQGNTLGGSRNEQLFTSGFTSLSYKWMTMNDSLAFLKQQYWFACFLWSLTWFFISGHIISVTIVSVRWLNHRTAHLRDLKFRSSTSLAFTWLLYYFLNMLLIKKNSLGYIYTAFRKGWWFPTSSESFVVLVAVVTPPHFL